MEGGEAVNRDQDHIDGMGQAKERDIMDRIYAEVWKPHPASVGIEASSLGGIRYTDGRPKATFANPKNGTWSFRVKSSFDGLPTTFQVARVVGELFCPDFRKDLRVKFRDGNRNNCAAENLEWISVSEKVRGSLRRTPATQ